MMQYFNIQMASQLSGVASATIRAWEKRYQAVTPQRAENKHRLYSENDIEKLSLLAKLTDFGQNIGKIAGLDIEELKNIYSVLLRRPYRKEEIMGFSKEKLNYHKSLGNLSLAIDSLKMNVIAHELKKIRMSLSAKEVAINILPSLYKMIETKFLNKEIGPGHQQLLYQTIAQHFSPYLADYEYPSTTRSPLFLATPHPHSKTGLLGAALLLSSYERNFLFLGSSSSEALSQVVNQLGGEIYLLEVQDYQIREGYHLDHYLDEVARLQERPLRVFIMGPDHLKQSIRRKNYTFIQGIQDLDQFLMEHSL